MGMVWCTSSSAGAVPALLLMLNAEMKEIYNCNRGGSLIP
jgi:hypothetical protein